MIRGKILPYELCFSVAGNHPHNRRPIHTQGVSGRCLPRHGVGGIQDLRLPDTTVVLKELVALPALSRRRRCFENAKPRRSAGGAQLNRSLGELEGPIRDPVLARFPKVAAFSSAESGSGEPPDRAQICPCDDDV